MKRPRRYMRWILILLLLLSVGGMVFFIYITPKRQEVPVARALPSPEELEAHCRDHIGPPRVEEVVDGVHVAIGYDLANTILIETAEGNVVVDVSSSPARARTVRQAFGELATRPTHSIIYTHSHIDHIGGATIWANDDTHIWATDAFVPHFFKQYGLFREAETTRGRRQFGAHVPDDAIPCSALGPRPDLEATLETGILLPTDSFSGFTSFDIGGVQFELHEAHGETHDQLFVWLPQKRTLLPGDNYYRAFPNLYTIRGTRPRPVDDWIAGLDAMRRLEADVLVPSHTIPVVGRAAIENELRTYRDGIQWIRDAVVRGANLGTPIDQLTLEIGLPEHLADAPALNELYGQIDWSVRAIYSNELGWFDGRPETLYPLPADEEAGRTVHMMGGASIVWDEVQRAQQQNEHRWALHLMSLIRLADEEIELPLDEAESESLRALAEGIYNTNGRAYLIESALERTADIPPTPAPTLNDEFIDSIPLSLLFDMMAIRLEPELSIEAHESVRFHFTDTGESFVITVRYGLAEVVTNEPLPRTPEPIATVSVDAPTWRRIALGITLPNDAVVAGDMVVDGNIPDFLRFVRRFRRGI